MKQPLTLSNMLNQTFWELKSNGRIFGIFLAVMVPITASFNWLDVGSPGDGFDFGFDINFTENLLAVGAGLAALYLALWLVSIALTYWFYAALMARDPSPGFQRFWPWAGIYILATLGIGFGLILLIVPGIILIVRWSIVLPLVIEAKSPAMDTFGESWEATSGSAWSILGTMIILLIVTFVTGAVLGGASAMLSGFIGAPTLIASAVTDALMSALFIAFAVAVFRLCHNETKELSEVFA
ncbi:hypothetical protein FGU71_13850 [Erythrobacter insulae]|uniref:Glycerophosphoryl diester phosphodiesterase membrane domain-containing protein n=1 Tax=Erythrobacter insulae TaxID=2584124 RepID=A0A547P7F0_9SPHN|nr:glycerophosphoryl diester phosphodiesterase membrane domain-containing protein [Erythrobacter insulae]TRD10070.1 hypothetical protein FGU71_13850 [Erythrobacter insulae]